MSWNILTLNPPSGNLLWANPEWMSDIKLFMTRLSSSSSWFSPFIWLAPKKKQKHFSLIKRSFVLIIINFKVFVTLSDIHSTKIGLALNGLIFFIRWKSWSRNWPKEHEYIFISFIIKWIKCWSCVIYKITTKLWVGFNTMFQYL